MARRLVLIVSALGLLALATSTNAATSLAYSDDFTDAKSGWMVHASDAVSLSYHADQYRISISQPLYTPSWAPIDEQLPDDVSLSAVVSCGGTGSCRCGLVWGESEDDYSWFYITSDGAYGVARYEDGEWTSPSPVPPTMSDLLRENTSNNLRVQLTSSSAHLFVNDAWIGSVNAHAGPPTAIGVAASQTTMGTVDVRFDAFAVDESSLPTSDWRYPTLAEAEIAAAWGDLQARERRPAASIFDPWKVYETGAATDCGTHVGVFTPLRRVASSAYSSQADTQQVIPTEILEALLSLNGTVSCFVRIFSDTEDSHKAFDRAMIRQGNAEVTGDEVQTSLYAHEGCGAFSYYGIFYAEFDVTALDPLAPFVLTVSNGSESLEFRIDPQKLGPDSFI